MSSAVPPSADSGPRHRRGGAQSPRRERLTRATGGVSAQASQAVGSLALQILAARTLGLEGLGQFATIYALVVLATAIVSGFVGDSLTVLDRQDPSIRAGLQVWWWSLSLLTGVGIGIVIFYGGLVDAGSAIVVTLAAVIFVIEDTLRRLLMASLLFWRIVRVDLLGMSAAMGYLWVVSSINDLTLKHFFIALLVGQAVAIIVAVELLPRNERWLSPLLGAKMRSVAAYGAWRSLQLSIKPALLAGVRILGVTLVSAAAIGEMEAARIYLSPAMIMVGGLTSVLFASFAARKNTPTTALLQEGDKAMALLFVAAAAFGLVAILAAPWAGSLITGGDYQLPLIALIGWIAFTVATAATSPYSALAAVRGRQSVVVGVRLAESTLSLLVVLALLLNGTSVLWVPLVLAVGVVIGGLVIRFVVLVRLSKAPRSAPTEREST